MKRFLHNIAVIILIARLVTAYIDRFEPDLPVGIDLRELPRQYVVQRLDNFNPQNAETFKTAYYENDEFFSSNGPLFVYIGGEWSIHMFTIQMNGHPFDMAREFNGSLFYPEHRYYGDSIPTSDLSTDNLRFLTVEQALADLANFIVHVKREPRYAESPVILIGLSYAGTMAAWFRQLYPHLTIGAWASSAPLLAKADFFEYKEIVGTSFGIAGSPQCAQRVQNAFEAAEQMIAENRHAEMAEMFQVCDGFPAHPMDEKHLFAFIAGFAAAKVQAHHPFNPRIQYFCDDLMLNKTEPSTDLSEYARAVRIKGNGCRELYPTYVEWRSNSSRNSRAEQSNRSWFYQTCTEFGWYQTSSSVEKPWFGSGFPIELWHNYCADIFAKRFDGRSIETAVARTNVAFGGLSPNIRNVYFTHGQLDPWRAMGVQTDVNESSPVDVIPLASHCNDMGSISERDSDEMRAVKNRIRELVRQWLSPVEPI